VEAGLGDGGEGGDEGGGFGDLGKRELLLLFSVFFSSEEM
jgi:hypothetical protein